MASRSVAAMLPASPNAEASLRTGRRADFAEHPADDVMDCGIALTGGGALLRGLDERLREETGLSVCPAGNPLESVVLGTGKCVEDFDALREVLIPDRRR